MGDSATGESLLSSESCLSSSSSSGVGSLMSAVSKDVCDEPESRMFVDVRDVARDTVLPDLFDFTWTDFGESLGRVL
jgi:hypothetical protein